MKQRLQQIGTFQELGYDEPHAPSLRDARGKRGPADKTEVLRYLRAGKLFIGSPGIDTDVFAPRKHNQWQVPEDIDVSRFESH